MNAYENCSVVFALLLGVSTGFVKRHKQTGLVKLLVFSNFTPVILGTTAAFKGHMHRILVVRCYFFADLYSSDSDITELPHSCIGVTRMVNVTLWRLDYEKVIRGCPKI